LGYFHLNRESVEATMQAIDNPELVLLTQQLNSIRFNSYFLSGKIEAFVSTFGSANPQVKTQKRSHASETNNSVVDLNRPSAMRDDLSIMSSTADGFMRPTRERSDSVTNASVSTLSSTFRKPSRRRTSSLGDLSEPSSQALLEDLITALNDNFPDYDFSDSKIDRFRECEVGEVMRLVNACLAEAIMMIPEGNQFLENIWTTFDRLVGLKKCEIFLFNRDPDDFDDNDMSNENHGSLWEFNIFLFRASLDRLVYFTCRARSVYRDTEVFREQSDMMVSEDEDDNNDEQPSREVLAEESDDEMDEDRERQVQQRQGDEEFDHEDLPDWDGII
jgi:hypothetical protein